MELIAGVTLLVWGFAYLVAVIGMARAGNPWIPSIYPTLRWNVASWGWELVRMWLPFAAPAAGVYLTMQALS